MIISISHDLYFCKIYVNSQAVIMNILLFWNSNRLPPSPQEYPILGLNLLRLLVQNRIAEFHTELELLSSSALENPCIKHAVELEQSFMEGAYNRVLSARQTVPHETYVYFMDLLAKTVRYDCSFHLSIIATTTYIRHMVLGSFMKMEFALLNVFCDVIPSHFSVNINVSCLSHLILINYFSYSEMK